jgi:hypothetical protein
MEPLEVILGRIDSLKKDLSANIEHGHWEHTPAQEAHFEEAKRHLDWYEGEDIWVEAVEAKDIFIREGSKPDTQKREAVRTQLEQIYDSSEWYSARYVVGEALGKTSSEVNKMIKDNLGYLFETVLKTVRIPVTRHHEVHGVQSGGSYAQYGSPTDEMYTDHGWTFGHFDNRWGECGQHEEEKAELDLPNEEAIRASKDLRNLFFTPKLDRSLRGLIGSYMSIIERKIYIAKNWRHMGAYEINSVNRPHEMPREDIWGEELRMGIDLNKTELEQVYQKSSKKEHRVLAGRSLGYSSLRILAREHPVGAIVTGVAVAGATSGLGYALAEYFSK